MLNDPAFSPFQKQKERVLTPVAFLSLFSAGVPVSSCNCSCCIPRGPPSRQRSHRLQHISRRSTPTSNSSLWRVSCSRPGLLQPVALQFPSSTTSLQGGGKKKKGNRAFVNARRNHFVSPHQPRTAWSQSQSPEVDHLAHGG